MSTARLLEAIRAGKTKKALKLLASAQPDRADAEGRTPLEVAAALGRTRVVQALLGRGAAPDGTGQRSPLCAAAVAGKHEVVALLLDAGASMDATCDDGWTPLHTAVLGGHRQVAAALLRSGATAHSVDRDGRTPLMAAVISGDERTVDALLEHGADPGHESPFGESALCHAVRLHRTEVVRRLEARGAALRRVDFLPLEPPGLDALEAELGELFRLETLAFPADELATHRSRLLNHLMLHLGLHGIADHWQRLDAQTCRDLLCRVLARDLVHGAPLRHGAAAEVLADRLLGLLPPGEPELFSNACWEGGRISGWSLLGGDTFEVAVVAMTGPRLVCLYTGQED